MKTPPDKLQTLVSLAQQLRAADKETELKEKELAAAKEKARRLREDTIPELMHELEMLKFTLSDGSTIAIKPDVYASLTDTNKQPAFRWLEENGFGGLIKSIVAVPFGRDKLEEARDLMLELAELKPDLIESVHTQTLKAFLREQIAAGKDIPLDLFNARPIWTTTIK